MKENRFSLFIPKNQLKSNLKKQLKDLCKNNCFVLTAPNLPLEELKKLVSLYTFKPLTFIISDKYFIQKNV